MRDQAKRTSHLVSVQVSAGKQVIEPEFAVMHDGMPVHYFPIDPRNRRIRLEAAIAALSPDIKMIHVLKGEEFVTTLLIQQVDVPLTEALAPFERGEKLRWLFAQPIARDHKPMAPALGLKFAIGDRQEFRSSILWQPSRKEQRKYVLSALSR